MRKLDFYQCENKGADQLCSNCTADQRLCFRYMDSTNSSSTYNQNFKILAFFCGCIGWFVSDQWSEIPKTGFLATLLISFMKKCSYTASRKAFVSQWYQDSLLGRSWHSGRMFDPRAWGQGSDTLVHLSRDVRKPIQSFRPGLIQSSMYSHRRKLEA